MNNRKELYKKLISSLFLIGLCYFPSQLFAQSDCCDQGDKPRRVTFRYVGGSCSNSSNSQGSKFECSGGGANNGAVFITATEDEDGGGKQYFSGNVSQGSSFIMDAGNAGDNEFRSKTFLNLYNGQGGSLLQTLNIHTSCSAPLVTGDQFGAVILEFIEFKNGVNCGPAIPPETCPDVTINTPTSGVFSTNGNFCTNTPITFEAPDLGFPCITYNWNFGSNASPQTFNGRGPVNVTFSSAGNFQVTLNTNNNCPPDPPFPTGIDCCETGGKPSSLRFKYVGGSCGSSNDNQGDKFECSGGSANSGSVFIRASQDEDGGGDQFFSGTVSLNSSFNVTDGGDKFGSKIFLNIFSSQGGSLLQTLNIHTSCSAPLVTGSQFGAILLEDLVFEDNGGSCSGTGTGSGPEKVCPDNNEICIPCIETTTVNVTVENCVPAAMVGDMVFNDLDADGIMDFGEPGVSGVSVVLSKDNGQFIAQTTTDGAGKYKFNDVMPNMLYKVTFTNIPNGFTFSPMDQGGNEETDSDVDPNTGMTTPIFISPGDMRLDQDAGITQGNPNQGAIGDKVFADTDRDGVQDPNEPGIGGVTVKLQDSNGNTLAQTTTNSSGNYSFTGLQQGLYKVMFNTPNGFNITMPKQGGNDDTDSDVQSDQMTNPFFLGQGQTRNDIDAGYVVPQSNNASIGNQVFADNNNNGIKEGNEPGISGVEVKLQDSNGNTLQTTFTDGNGNYNFTNLQSGNYKIMFGTPNGFSPSPRTGFGDNNVDNNNDNNPNNGNMTDVVFLSPGENNPTVDAGFAPQAPQLASVGNNVWNDLDKDGFKDPGEPGIGGVAVKLQDPNGNTLQTTTTDGNGFYQFSNLASGNYKIMFGTVPGFISSPRTGFGDNDVDNNSDADPNNGNMTDVFFLSPGESNQTIDAGCIKTDGGGPDDCKNLQVSSSNGNINITNIPASAKLEYNGPSTGYAVQVICDGNCGTSQTLSNLSAGDYTIKSQSFNPYCYAEFRVTVGGGGNPCDNQGGDSDGDGVCDNVDNCRFTSNSDQADNDGDGIGNVCDDTPNGGGGGPDVCKNLQVAATNGGFTISNIPAGAKLEYNGPGTGYALVLICDSNCGSSQNISGLSAGDYTIKSQTFDPYCYAEFRVTVGGGGNPCDNQGGDSDGDGICDNVDNCRFIANSDQADNDGDGIGNVCDDTPNGGGGGPDVCKNLQVSSTNGGFNISNIPTGAKLEYNGPSTGYAIQLICEGNCGTSQSVTNLGAGEYTIKAQTFNPYCYAEYKVTVGGGGGNPCDNQGGDSDYDGVCDNVDNCRFTPNSDQADNDNDGIGNVCDDTPNGGGGGNPDCNAVNANMSNGQLTITGLNAPIVVLKVFNSSWQTIFECTGNKCPETVIFQPDASERTCHIDIQFYTADWHLICERQVTVTNGSSQSRSAPQLNFSAYNKGQGVNLEWLTNTGWRNHHFEVERSTDGKSFERIDKVMNGEDSDELVYYSNIDKAPIMGDNYYRLKQVYLDGSFEYTDIKLINFNLDVNALTIYPNPVEQELFINLKPYEGRQATLILTNQFGQALQQVNIEQISRVPTTLNMNNMPNGLYQITIQVDGGLKPITKKILVNRMY